jgi:branched-chain amino acid aminotransferase
MARLHDSMERVSMPSFDKEGFLNCIKELLKLEKEWIPKEDGFSLYLRPTAIGTNNYIGLTPPDSCKIYCILNPTGGYFKTGFNPVCLYADTENTRAWPGGTGSSKLGGNYGPTIKLSEEVMAKHGANQILWLSPSETDPSDHIATEVGAMNIFFVIAKEDGSGYELTTAPLSDVNNTILPGITRKSILEYVGVQGNSDVNTAMNKKITATERWLSMSELVKASQEGRLLEAFGAGTAAVINPVNKIIYKDHQIDIPTGNDIGPLAKHLWSTIIDIQYGRKEHEWSIVV